MYKQEKIEIFGKDETKMKRAITLDDFSLHTPVIEYATLFLKNTVFNFWF